MGQGLLGTLCCSRHDLLNSPSAPLIYPIIPDDFRLRMICDCQKDFFYRPVSKVKMVTYGKPKSVNTADLRNNLASSDLCTRVKAVALMIGKAD